MGEMSEKETKNENLSCTERICCCECIIFNMIEKSPGKWNSNQGESGTQPSS